jgi:hypothetical protein
MPDLIIVVKRENIAKSIEALIWSTSPGFTVVILGVRLMPIIIMRGSLGVFAWLIRKRGWCFVLRHPKNPYKWHGY